MRKNLFRDIIFIVLLTIISIASLAIYRGASIKDQVSTQLITNSSRLIQKRFTIFLAPFESSLEVLARSSAVKELSGDLSSIKKLETIFSPYLDVYDNLGEITLITSSGDITSIVRSRDGYTSLVIQGSGSLDPSQPDSTLFRGSVASPDDKPVFWHESFSASNDKSGVSAGISVVQEDGEILVIAFTIPGSKILQFIADIEMVEGADIILFNSKGLFISRQQLSRAVKSKPLQTIHHPAPPEDMILKAIESWVLKGSNENEVERFTIEGMKWWAGFSHLGSGSGDGSICVLVPESGIMEDVHGHLLNLAVPIGLIVIFALIMSFNLVRRYSFQLKDLPHQHVIDTEFTESIKRIIHLVLKTFFLGIHFNGNNTQF